MKVAALAKHRLLAHFALVAMIASVMTVAMAPQALAATINVDIEDDEVDDDGDCSLREAVDNANDNTDTHDDCEAGTGVDTISLDENENYELDAGPLVFTDSDETTIDGGSTRDDPDDDSSASIDGGGSPGSHVCDGDDVDATDRVIEVDGGAALELVDVNVQDGVVEGENVDAAGGGILSNGTLTLTRAVVENNLVCAGGTGILEAEGGGIWATGTLTITDSTIKNNDAVVSSSNDDADAEGGGLYWLGTTGDITGSTFSGNIARVLAGDVTSAEGGGIWASSDYDIENSTLSNNDAINEDLSTELGGGAYQSANIADMLFVTVTKNSAADGGGLAAGGTIVIENSLVVDQDEGEDCFEAGGTVTADGYNLDSDGTCDDADTGDADLGSLDDNGGPTETHLPDDSGDGVNQIDDPCPPDEDQRGEERPDDDDDECDAGSVEHQQSDEDSVNDNDNDNDNDADDELNATPETVTNVLPGDTTHTIEVQFDESALEDDDEDQVDFKIISGPNVRGDAGDTDFECTLGGDECTITYTSNGVAGTDVICAWLDTDDDDNYNPTGSSSDGGSCDTETLTPATSTLDNDNTDLVQSVWQVATTPTTATTTTTTTSTGPTTTRPPRRTVFVGSAMALQLNDRKNVFKGDVFSARRRCLSRRVTLKKVDKGPNSVIDRKGSGRDGFFRFPVNFEPDGRYYATAARKVFTSRDGTTVVCQWARSRNLRAS